MVFTSKSHQTFSEKEKIPLQHKDVYSLAIYNDNLDLKNVCICSLLL